MARRRKTRTHNKGAQPVAPSDNIPKSFVIKHGQVGSSLTQLVRDVRKVMEPNTASRLRVSQVKERSRNKLKDYLVMAPALKVSHLLAFTLTEVAPSLRIVRLSDGPTLSFRVERYSLIKDIKASSRHAKNMGAVEYLSSPLLVLASFPQPGPGTPPHPPLVMKAFQTLFPPLSPRTITLSSARRVVLVSYNADRGTVDWRHYRIAVKPYGVSRRVRKVLDGAALDLGSEKDIADFVLRRRGATSDGYESAMSDASSAGGDDGDAVDLADDYVGRNNKKGQKRAIRLDEIGPRMELRLVKITEGIPGKPGAVIYHEFVKKSKAQTAKQKAEHAEKERLRKQRRDEQERNIARKKAALRNGKAAAEIDEGDVDESEGNDDTEDEEDDNDGWDEDEEISEGEVSGDEIAEGVDSDGGSESESEERPPAKRVKMKGRR
ncbi:Brix-domain-containing protein [Vararia minispora EC-137]|uniref:Brix-domain-containing protein n=1 Tax=Vararia minispora EC-137 TaxID=1314806 RepID=A0ACB8QVA3_9AGAM|nr:Brix-domain-containing protein [Vararia minispora EC-137]